MQIRIPLHRSLLHAISGSTLVTYDSSLPVLGKCDECVSWPHPHPTAPLCGMLNPAFTCCLGRSFSSSPQLAAPLLLSDMTPYLMSPCLPLLVCWLFTLTAMQAPGERQLCLCAFMLRVQNTAPQMKRCSVNIEGEGMASCEEGEQEMMAVSQPGKVSGLPS